MTVTIVLVFIVPILAVYHCKSVALAKQKQIFRDPSSLENCPWKSQSISAHGECNCTQEQIDGMETPGTFSIIHEARDTKGRVQLFVFCINVGMNPSFLPQLNDHEAD